MKHLHVPLAIAFVGLITSGSFAQAVRPDPDTMRVILPEKIQWQGDPATGDVHFPLFGDPKKSGMYGFLAKISPGHFSEAHSFSNARYITVISGTWWISSSNNHDISRTFPVPAGSTVMDMPGKPRWSGAKDIPTIIEVVGMGPVTVKYGPQPEFFEKRPTK